MTTVQPAGGSGATDPIDRPTDSPAPEETWNLADVYEDDESFAAAKTDLQQRLTSLKRFQGRLAGSAAELAEALDAVSELRKELSRLYAYASMRADSDTRAPAGQAMREEADLLATDFSRTISFLRPEILAIDPATLERFLESEQTLAPHRHPLRNLIRQREHVLSPPEERIMAEAGLLGSGTTSLFGILNDAELPRPELALSTGETVVLTPAAFSRHRASADRDDRQLLFREYFGAYERFKRTLAQNLFQGVKTHVFVSRARGYRSCLAAALDAENIPTRVYRNLIEQVHSQLPVLHRYFRLRARALGLEQLGYPDLYGPLVADERPPSYTAARGRELMISAVGRLGEEYLEGLDRAFRERWIDWHVRPGKRSGAYATGAAYDVHPYVLLNFNNDYESVSTLAHEMGHAMHSYFSNGHQPYPTSDYSIFVAEVASTFNEELLHRRMIDEAGERSERMFLLGRSLDGLRATLFRQTMFAEFELAIHERAERGEPLTAESLCRIYLDLLRRYHGHDEGVVDIEDRYAVEWAAIPHFHYNFYVYQYSTGIVAANALCEGVENGRPQARERYLRFLSAGGSDYSLELLRNAGVDLERPEPYEATIRSMSRKLDRLESLLDG